MNGPRDDRLDQICFRLVVGGEAAVRLPNHLEDLRDEAFLRRVGDQVKVSGGNVDDDGGRPGVETVGNMWARRLWDRVVHASVIFEEIPVLEREILNYFMAGRGADDEAYRGSLISHGEFEGRKRNQRKQAASGEHVPLQLVDQPHYPGRGGR
jgi:hypothetical protein